MPYVRVQRGDIAHDRSTRHVFTSHTSRHHHQRGTRDVHMRMPAHTHSSMMRVRACAMPADCAHAHEPMLATATATATATLQGACRRGRTVRIIISTTDPVPIGRIVSYVVYSCSSVALVLHLVVRREAQILRHLCQGDSVGCLLCPCQCKYIHTILYLI